MKKSIIIMIIILLISLSSCTQQETNISLEFFRGDLINLKIGEVYEKEIIPPHKDTKLIPAGKTVIPITNYYGQMYKVKIYAIEEETGSIARAEFYVTQEEYELIEIGQIWDENLAHFENSNKVSQEPALDPGQLQQ